jgi:hypothetical protein
MYGLGQSPIDLGTSAAEAGLTGAVSLGLLASGVAAPVGAAMMVGSAILDALGIGHGRREADAIVPVQNSISNVNGTGRLDEINRAIPTATIPQLQMFANEVVKTAIQFRQFVSDPRFTDGRASHQALDTLMPLIDGTDATGAPCSVNKWGNPCNGGTLGTIQRQILQLGGTIGPPLLTQGVGSTIPSLQFPQPGFGYLPQAGTLPPTAPYSPIQSPGLITVNAGSHLPLLAGAGLLIFILLRRRR